MSGAREMGDIERRLANMVKIGEVEEITGDRARVRVAGILSAPLRWAASAGEDNEWKPPNVGSQVVVLSPSGELANGVIVCGLYRSTYPAPSDNLAVRKVTFRDGTVVEYDSDASVLKVNAAGDVEIAASGEVRLGGAAASDPVVRQSDLDAALNTIKNWASTVTFPTPSGPSSPTTMPLVVSASGSSKVKST